VESTEGRMVLTGEVEDLDGLLKCINDLGLKLLSVQILSQEAR
jgi:hypothetical protein